MNRSHLQAVPDRSPKWAAGLQNKAVTAVLAMMALVPLLTGSSLLNGAAKVAAFEAFGAILLMLVLSRMQVKGAATRIKETLTAGPNLPILLLVGYAAVSCAFSPYKNFSLMETMRVGFCALLYFVMVYQLRTKGALQMVTDGLLAVTAIVALVGFTQMGTGGIMAIEGTFGSHELLGSFLMLMLPIALALGLTERGDSKRQLAAQVVALMVGACLLVARTRSAWLGAAFSMLVLAIMAVRYSPVLDEKRAGRTNMLQSLRQRKHLILVPAVILTGAVALVVGLTQTSNDLSKRAATFAKLDADDSYQTRVAMWNGTLKMIAQKPLLGSGIGTYPLNEQQYTHHGDPTSRVLKIGTSHSNIAHNYYLQTAAETGLIGLGLYLAAIAGFFIVGFRALRNLDMGLRKAVLMGCLAATAGQLIDALGSPAYNFASVSLFQWAILGMGMFAAGIGMRSRSEEASVENTTFATATPKFRRTQSLIGAVAAIAVMSQIIPTMNVALAQTCSVNGATFAFRGNAGQETGTRLGANKSLTLKGTVDGSPISGTNDGDPNDNDYVTVVLSGSGNVGTYVTINQSQAAQGIIVVNRTANTTGIAGKTVLVTATYHGLDGNGDPASFTVAYTINLQ